MGSVVRYSLETRQRGRLNSLLVMTVLAYTAQLPPRLPTREVVATLTRRRPVPHKSGSHKFPGSCVGC